MKKKKENKQYRNCYIADIHFGNGDTEHESILYANLYSTNAQCLMLGIRLESIVNKLYESLNEKS